jgi:hypothetical protein
MKMGMFVDRLIIYFQVQYYLAFFFFFFLQIVDIPFCICF